MGRVASREWAGTEVGGESLCAWTTAGISQCQPVQHTRVHSLSNSSTRCQALPAARSPELKAHQEPQTIEPTILSSFHHCHPLSTAQPKTTTHLLPTTTTRPATHSGTRPPHQSAAAAPCDCAQPSQTSHAAAYGRERQHRGQVGGRGERRHRGEGGDEHMRQCCISGTAHSGS